jgi:hypothetical protein
MVPPCRARLRGRAALGFLVLSALYSGCQAVETSHVRDPYYEHEGMWCGNYEIGSESARLAALAALAELNMPVCRQGQHHRGIFIDTRTPENLEARVVLLPLGGHVQGTRICVRVGGFGTHREVCERLLDAIAQHQDALWHSNVGAVVPTAPPAAMPGSPPTTAAAPPRSQSSEPSLPPQPVPVELRN